MKTGSGSGAPFGRYQCDHSELCRPQVFPNLDLGCRRAACDSYGRDFEQYPDVDDTSRTLVFLEKMAQLTQRTGVAESRQKGLRWLLNQQNSDGGWGAFDRNNVGSRMARLFTAGLSDSVDFFDDSSANNTGHVLAALGAYGLTVTGSRAVKRAARFLRRTQDPGTGLWKGRWGINTLYRTTRPARGFCGQENRHGRPISSGPLRR